jgi:flagellar motor switch protein FliM
LEDDQVTTDTAAVDTTAPAAEPEGFDFRHPGKSARDGIDRLESAHDAFVESLQRSMADRLGSQVDIKFAGVEQVGLGRYLRTLPPPAVLTSFTMDPYPGRAVLEVGSAVGLGLIDALLGGTGEFADIRRLTDVEHKLMESVADCAFGALGRALEPLGVEPQIEIADADPIQLAIQAGRDFVVSLHYAVSVADGLPHRERLVLAYPVTALHDIAEGGRPGERDERARSGREAIERMIPGLDIPFCVRLQASRIRFDDLAGLEPGDVLRLDHSLEDLAVGFAGGVPVVEGRIGTARASLALEITNWLEDQRVETA